MQVTDQRTSSTFDSPPTPLESPQQLIHRLHEENGSSPRDAKNLARSLQRISGDLYTDVERFVYELLQNADDTANDGDEVAVHIAILDQHILFLHDGRPFSPKDVDALCSIGDSTKAADPHKTGYKGIGFKSVFGTSERVFVRSGPFSFRFDRSAFDAPENIPWQIKPIWCEGADYPDEVGEYHGFAGAKVAIVLQVDDLAESGAKVLDLFDEPRLLLFLRHIASVRLWVQATGETRMCEKVRDGDIVQLLVDEAEHSAWTVGDYEFDIPEDIRATLADDKRVPEKMKDAQRAKVSFAAPVGSDGIQALPADDAPLFTYLPTRVTEYGFPFLVNADFLTTANREGIHADNPWNHYIFEEIGAHLPVWLRDVTGVADLRSSVLRLLPPPEEHTEEIMARYDAGLQRAITTVAFVPTRDGALIRTDQALIDSTGISGVLESHFDTLWTTDRSLIASDLKEASALLPFGATRFGPQEVSTVLASDGLEGVLTPELAGRLLSHIYEKTKLRPVQSVLDALPLLDDQEGVWRPASQELYLRIPSDTRERLRFGTFPVLHRQIAVVVEASEELRTWTTEKLGLKVFSAPEAIRTKLATDQALALLGADDAVPVSQLVMEHWEALSQPTQQKLRRLPVHLQAGSIRAAEDTYLSAPYKPAYPLEEVADLLEAGPFVSDTYLDAARPVSEWRRFFRALGLKSPSALEVLRKLVFRKAQQGAQLGQDRLIKLARLTRALLAQIDDLSNKDRLTLRSFPLLTAGGEVKPASACYPSAAYDPDLDLEAIAPTLGLGNFHFISPAYLAAGESANDWRAFFGVLGTVEATAEDICERFVVPALPTVTTKHAAAVGEFVFDTYQNGLRRTLVSKLGALPLLCTDGAIRPAKDCLFPRSLHQELEIFSDLELPLPPLVSEDYIDWGAPNEVEHFFKELGVTRLSQEQVLDRAVTQIVDDPDNTVPPDRAVSVGRALFRRRGALSPDAWKKLQGLPLLIKEGKTRRASHCYLPNVYAPPKDLEHLFEGTTVSEFVSAEYLTEGESPDDWRSFFYRLGVNKRPIAFLGARTITFNGDSHNYRSICFGGNQKKYAFKNQSLVRGLDSNLGRLPFTERIWPHLQEHWSDFAKTGTTVQIGQVWKSTRSHFQFILQTANSIPCTDGECRKPKEVYDRKLDWIVRGRASIAKLDFSEEIADYVGLRRELDLQDALAFADALANEFRLKEANWLYRNLAKRLQSGLSAEDRSTLESWSGRIRLRAADGSFQPASSLSFFSEGVSLASLQDPALADIPNPDVVPSDQYRALLKKLGAREITPDAITVESQPSGERSELDELVHDAACLAYIAKHLGIDDEQVQSWSEALREQAEHLSIHLATSISVTAGDGAFRQSRANHFDRPNGKIWYTDDWNHRRNAELGGYLLEALQIDASKLDASRLMDLFEAFDPASEPPENPAFQKKETAANGESMEPVGFDQNPISPRPWKSRPQVANDFSAERSKEELSSFADALMKRLGSAPFGTRWQGNVYHFTHVENAASILKAGVLKARSRTGEFKDSAGASLIGHTTDQVKGFARFYFRPHTPTQYHNECLGRRHGDIYALCPVPVFFEVNLERLLATHGARCAVSNGNLSTQWARFGNSEAFVERIDTNNMYASFGQVDGDSYMDASQQEFIVHEEVRLGEVPFKVICRTDQDKTTLEQLLREQGVEDQAIRVDPAFYHQQNAAVFVQRQQGVVTISIKGGTTSIEGKLRVNSRAAPASLSLSSANGVVGVTVDKGLWIEANRDVQIAALGDAPISVIFKEGGKEWLVYRDG